MMMKKIKVKVMRRSHTASSNCRGCGKRYPSFEVFDGELEDMWCKRCLSERADYELINPPKRDPAWYCPVHKRKFRLKHRPNENAIYKNGCLITDRETSIDRIKVCPYGCEYPFTFDGNTGEKEE